MKVADGFPSRVEGFERTYDPAVSSVGPLTEAAVELAEERLLRLDKQVVFAVEVVVEQPFAHTGFFGHRSHARPGKARLREQSTRSAQNSTSGFNPTRAGPTSTIRCGARRRVISRGFVGHTDTPAAAP